MLHLPVLQFERHPQKVDAKGDEGEQEPFNPVADQLAACAIEEEAVAFDNGVLGHPFLMTRVDPRKGDGKGDDQKQDAQNIVADELNQAGVKTAIAPAHRGGGFNRRERFFLFVFSYDDRR